MSSTEIEVGTEVAGPEDTPPMQLSGIDSLIELALERDGAVEVIERLAALREREQDRDAERQFVEAFTEFRSRCPAIPRNKRGSSFVDKATGTKSYVMYSPLDTIQGIVDPLLFGLGFSYHWSSEATATSVITKCTLRHVGGHERTSSMVLPVSGPPKSSATQAHAGTRSFNKRLTLSDVLGIQTTDDADGQDDRKTGERVSEEQARAIREHIDAGNLNEGRLLGLMEVSSVEEIPAGRYDEVIRVAKAREERNG